MCPLQPCSYCLFVVQESADERWRPILGVEQILLSVISLFSDPNDTSPANIDAAVRDASRPTLLLYVLLFKFVYVVCRNNGVRTRVAFAERCARRWPSQLKADAAVCTQHLHT